SGADGLVRGTKGRPSVLARRERPDRYGACLARRDFRSAAGPHQKPAHRVDHIGIRVRDLDRALSFYRALGFELVRRAEGDDVAIVRNEQAVELNLVFNANAGDPATNILMDVPEKFPGYTHIALRVASIP